MHPSPSSNHIHCMYIRKRVITTTMETNGNSRKIIKKSHSQLGQVKIILQLHVHYVGRCYTYGWKIVFFFFSPWTSFTDNSFLLFINSNWDLWEWCRFIFFFLVYLLHFPTHSHSGYSYFISAHVYRTGPSWNVIFTTFHYL